MFDKYNKQNLVPLKLFPDHDNSMTKQNFDSISDDVDRVSDAVDNDIDKIDTDSIKLPYDNDNDITTGSTKYE